MARRVTFPVPPQLEGSASRKHPATATTTETFREFRSEDITGEELRNAAQLFSDHYGVWNTPPGRPGGKPGGRVKMSPSRLRKQYLPAGARYSYVNVHVDDVLAGNAFACRWNYEGRQVCWITQLVVHREYRRRRLATHLLEKIREVDDEIVGIMSAHPAACIAASKACADVSFEEISTDFIKAHANGVITASPIAYVREARLRGSIFDPNTHAPGADGLVSGVDTQFFVDHAEPLEALEWVRDRGLAWPLGSLPEGHEFLLMFESSRRRRSPSSPR